MSSNKQDCSCLINATHRAVVERVQGLLASEEQLLDLANLFKVLGDGTRIKIISALLEAEMCVCDIAILFNMTKSAISHQLRILRQTRLVKYRKQGKHSYYSLDDAHVQSIIKMGLLHIKE